MEEDYGKLRVTTVLRNGRCRYDPLSKARLVEACLEPGASVARLVSAIQRFAPHLCVEDQTAVRC